MQLLKKELCERSDLPSNCSNISKCLEMLSHNPLFQTKLIHSVIIMKMFHESISWILSIISNLNIASGLGEKHPVFINSSIRSLFNIKELEA